MSRFAELAPLVLTARLDRGLSNTSRRSRVSPSATRCVLLYVAAHERRTLNASMIGNAIDLCHSSTLACLKSLERQGLIEVITRASAQGKIYRHLDGLRGHRYQINIDRLAAAQCSTA